MNTIRIPVEEAIYYLEDVLRFGEVVCLCSLRGSDYDRLGSKGQQHSEDCLWRFL